jgi:hypothetical protein
LEELKVKSVGEKLRRYKSKLGMICNENEQQKMPEIMLNYRPNAWRWFERPLKRLLDKAKTGLSRPNSSGMMMNTEDNLQKPVCIN